MNKLRHNLLINIITNKSIDKYLSSYNQLKGIISLEHNDKENKLDSTLFEEFKSIKQQYEDKLFSESIRGIPLMILEQYYVRNYKDLSKYIFIEYGQHSYDIKAIELYEILENFNEKIMLLAIKIADYYNLEIKIKSGMTSDSLDIL